MSSLAIEARSLSSLTALASNPPAYPRNPTHVRHEPLVLYIARVPGSRDVFLSPMKPREKVVTAEDIQSSLYFVHVDHPEDARLVTPPPDFRESDYAEPRSISPNRLPGPTVQRKAIPGATAGTSMPAPPRRKPVPGSLAPINDFESRQNIHARNYAQRSSGLLGPDYTPRRSFDSLQDQGENENPPPLPRRPSEQSSPSSVSLTLIRRDPASSAQWNVARIEDPSTLEISSSTVNDPTIKKKIGAPMYIEVTNPGYSKFLNSETGKEPILPNRNSDLSVRSYNAPNPLQFHASEISRDELLDKGETSFRRRLWMEGSKYANGGFGHRKLGSQDSNIGRQSPRGSYDLQRDRHSVDLRPPETPPYLSREGQSYSTIQVSDRQSSFRGYVFMSPWNGRCEFTTGAGGGSMKCRHMIPGAQGAPPVAMPVSELRFNLPSSSKASTPRGEEPKRSSFFHRPRHSRHNSSVSDFKGDNTEDVRNSIDRLDLSLGQEFAGGGFGGKQAKLGKLIIEDEGLKMIDLLVAANLALWWRAYEKTDAK